MTKGFGMPFTGLFLMPPAVAAALVGRCWALDHERLRHLRAIRVSRRNRSAAEKRGELLVVAIMVLIAIIVFWVCAVFA
ncbi:hypothetical protein CHH27_04685 [Labrenzia sp. VG12]|nr:hypothetical protein CHH27_04685 [Labrenzia sp. VG12]